MSLDQQNVVRAGIPANPETNADDSTLSSGRSFQNGPRSIDPFKDEILEKTRKHQFLIIVGPTGCGKSSKVPQWYLEEGYTVELEQPRVFPTLQIAQWISDEIGNTLGDLVGHLTAHHRLVSESSRLVTYTDGFKNRESMGGGTTPVNIRIFDEFHELTNDQIFSLASILEDISRGNRSKVVIMSATLDIEPLKKLLGKDCAVVHVTGRTYEIHEIDVSNQPSVIDFAASQIALDKNGLLFSVGKRDLDSALRSLRLQNVNAELLPCHADLSDREKQRVLETFPRPKFIAGTTILQTSVTIDGLDIVIDLGLKRESFYRHGVEHKRIVLAAESELEQRMGRGGRTRDSEYANVRLGEGKNALGARPPFPIAEPLRGRLDEMNLRCRVSGRDPRSMPFNHLYSEKRMGESDRALKRQGLLDEELRPTENGIRVAKLPALTYAGNILLAAERLGVTDAAAKIVALIQAGHIGQVATPESGAEASRSGCLEQLRLFDEAQRMASDEEREAHGIIVSHYNRAVNQLALIEKRFADTITRSAGTDPEKILAAIAYGLSDYVYRGRTDEHDRWTFTIAGENGAVPVDIHRAQRSLGFDSIHAGAKLVTGIPLDLDALDLGCLTDREKFRIRKLELLTNVSVFNPGWLVELGSPLVDGTPTGRFSYSADWDGVYETYAIKYRGTQMHGYVHAKDPSIINHQLARFLADVNEGNKRGAEADLMVTHPVLASVILENRRLNSLPKRELRDLGLSPRGYGGMLEFYSERLGDVQRLKDLADPKRLALR